MRDKSPTMSTRQIAAWLWKASQPVRGRIVCNALLGIASVGCSLLFVWATKRLVDIATLRDADSFGPVTAILICSLVMQLLLSALSRRLDISTQTLLTNHMRLRLFSHLMKSRMETHDVFHSGDMVNRMENDVATITSLLCATIPGLLVTVTQLCAAFAFLAWLNARLAVAVVVIMPVALIVSKLYIRRTRALTREIRAADSRLQATMQENLQNRMLVSVMMRTAAAIGSFTSVQDELRSRQLKRGNIAIFSRGAMQLGFMTGYTVTFLWSVGGLFSGTVTFGMMTAFLQLVSQVQRPVVDMSQRLPAFINTAVAVERLKELLDIECEEQGDEIRLSGPTGVRFTDATFAYPGGRHNIFSNFSHDFRPGSVTAVVGETGAGKSTMLRLMLGLLTPQSGRVELYDSSAAVIASPLTRCNFIVVPQGNSLMSGTIRDNLRLADDDASDERMWQALHTAAADFVAELPDGLDTMCGENSTGLSVGQAQRVAIARGLLRKGGVMVLDEPTSALDTVTESILIDRLTSHADGKTIIMVTHREELIAACDNVLKINRL